MSAYLTGIKGESVIFVDIYVNEKLMNHLTVPEGQKYRAYISGKITSKDDEVEVRGIAEDGKIVRSKNGGNCNLIEENCLLRDIGKEG